MTEKSVKHTKLNALILVGGKSKRMGYDKSSINYHGKAQWEHLVALLENQVEKVYISVRANQEFEYPHLITDKEKNLGPFGAILTALDAYQKEAFLVIATDLPFIDRKTIELLIKNRDTEKFATALKTTNKDYPEPLACIWEPKALPILEQFYQNNIYKPIQVLKEVPIQTVIVADKIVQNINTQVEFRDLKRNKKHLGDDLLSDI